MCAALQKETKMQKVSVDTVSVYPITKYRIFTTFQGLTFA